MLQKLFKGRNYSRAETIQGQKLFAEIRYLVFFSLSQAFRYFPCSGCVSGACLNKVFPCTTTTKKPPPSDYIVKSGAYNYVSLISDTIKS